MRCAIEHQGEIRIERETLYSRGIKSAAVKYPISKRHVEKLSMVSNAAFCVRRLYIIILDLLVSLFLKDRTYFCANHSVLVVNTLFKLTKDTVFGYYQ